MSETREQIRTTATRWFEEVWNQRREATIDELLDATSVCCADGGVIVGPEQFRAGMYVPFLTAFPDLVVTVEDTIVEGDRAVVRWSARGTHQGPGPGLPPTGRRVTLQGMTWITVRDGKLAEGWQSSNLTDVVRTLAPA
jgi:steroid delta-isomerase-like uncharacterized protein